jgi:hypothetical protein
MVQTTEEQQEIVTAVKEGYNVSVNSNPGSGKTATAIEVIKQTTENVLIVMYNTNLCAQTTNDVTKSQFFHKRSRKIGVYTYHSLLAALTKMAVPNDVTFIEIMTKIESGEIVIEPSEILDFSIFIIDEAQDIRPPFFWLISKLLQLCLRSRDVRILILGQEEQMLYTFYANNKADIRFMSFIDILFENLTTRPWKKLKLSRSFRLSPQIAATVNQFFKLPNPIIGANKDGPPVSLHLCNPYKDCARILNGYIRADQTESNPALKVFYPFSQVFLVCPFVNEKSPLIQIVNMLQSNGIYVHVIRTGSLADNALKADVSFSQNKAQAMSCHATKGLQNKIVIFINTNPLFYGSGKKYTTQNQTFVTMTRPEVRLIILQDVKYISGQMIEILANVSQPENLRIIKHRNLPSLERVATSLAAKLEKTYEESKILLTPRADQPLASKKRSLSSQPPKEAAPQDVSQVIQQKEEDFIEEMDYGIIPKQITIYELFSFLDAINMTRLMSFVKMIPVQPALEMIERKSLSDVERQEDFGLHQDLLKNEQFGFYASDLIVSLQPQNRNVERKVFLPIPIITPSNTEQVIGPMMDISSDLPSAGELIHGSFMEPIGFKQIDTKNNKHFSSNVLHVNVLNFVGCALLLAMEFIFGSRLPRLATKVKNNLDPCHPLYQRLCNAIDTINDLLAHPLPLDPKEQIETLFSRAQILLTSFVTIVIVHDAIYHYSDRSHLIDNYSFIQKPSVFLRLRRLFDNVQTILLRFHSATKLKLEFGQTHECNLLYQIEGEPGPGTLTKISGLSNIKLGDRAVIHCIHAPNTSTTDLLTAATLLEVAGVDNLFICNIFDGAVLKVDVTNRLEFLTAALTAKTQLEKPLSDSEFINLYKVELQKQDTELQIDDFVYPTSASSSHMSDEDHYSGVKILSEDDNVYEAEYE